MKAISIMQPWASLIVGGPRAYGSKRIENRTWRPSANMDGTRFAIHASKKIDLDAFMRLANDRRFDARRWPYRNPAEFPTAAIVGVATIDRVLTSPCELPIDQMQWWHGPIGWLLRDVRCIDPIRGVRGALGFWPMPDDVESAVVAQIGAAA